MCGKRAAKRSAIGGNLAMERQKDEQQNK